MSTSTLIYQGKLRAAATHTKSGEIIITDAPTDNNGKGEAFSPTDLVATALASCAVTIMGIAARNHDIDIDGTEAIIQKHMASDPRRISGIDVQFVMPRKSYSTKEQKILEHAALTCPVTQSLSKDLAQHITFDWYDPK